MAFEDNQEITPPAPEPAPVTPVEAVPSAQLVVEPEVTVSAEKESVLSFPDSEAAHTFLSLVKGKIPDDTHVLTYIRSLPTKEEMRRVRKAWKALQSDFDRNPEGVLHVCDTVAGTSLYLNILDDFLGHLHGGDAWVLDSSAERISEVFDAIILRMKDHLPVWFTTKEDFLKEIHDRRVMLLEDLQVHDAIAQLLQTDFVAGINEYDKKTREELGSPVRLYDFFTSELEHFQERPDSFVFIAAALKQLNEDHHAVDQLRKFLLGAYNALPAENTSKKDVYEFFIDLAPEVLCFGVSDIQEMNANQRAQVLERLVAQGNRPKLVRSFSFTHLPTVLDARAKEALFAIKIVEAPSDIIVAAEQFPDVYQAMPMESKARGIIDLLSAGKVDSFHIFKHDLSLFDEQWLKRLFARCLESDQSGVLTNPEVLAVLETVVSRQQIENMITGLRQLQESPAKALRVIAPHVIDSLDFKHVETQVRNISDIFLKNNLPEVGKVYKVFDVLYPPERIQNMLRAYSSPTLKVLGARQRALLLYRDLLSIHVHSGNDSLKNFLQLFESSRDIFQQFEDHGMDSLTAAQRTLLSEVLTKSERLFEASMLGSQRSAMHAVTVSAQDLDAVYQQLRQSLGVTEGQSFMERLEEMFLKPVGFARVSDVIRRMDEVKAVADTRNRAAEAELQGHPFMFREGDLFKGFASKYVRDVLQNGSVAREFLGADAESDKTPFDTDLFRVLPGDPVEIEPLFTLTKVEEFGAIIMVTKGRDQFQLTSSAMDPRVLKQQAHERGGKPELFDLGKIHDSHYGIRTGFAATEIDAFIVCSFLQENILWMENLKMRIVINGFYIPVYDTHGNGLFSPAAYDEYRARFLSGIQSQPSVVSEHVLDRVPEQVDALREIRQQNNADIWVVEKVNRSIVDCIKRELMVQGISVVDSRSDLVTDAEIYNIGSSARRTNLPGSFDYDVQVKCAIPDRDRVLPRLRDAIRGRLGGDPQPNGETDDQVRVVNAPIAGQLVEIDVTFLDKAGVLSVESHEMVRDRLEAIETQCGTDAYERVLANIILTKKILKNAGIYKKFHGGFGGIGVENWILSHGGNMGVAFETFRQAAFGDGDTLFPYNEFIQYYHVLDPGVNSYTQEHNDYIQQLSESAYQQLAQVVRDYLDRMRGTIMAD